MFALLRAPIMIPMQACIYCNSKTKLYRAGIPVCVECDALIEARKPPRERADIHLDTDEGKPEPEQSTR
jgi:hypothetical protein